MAKSIKKAKNTISKKSVKTLMETNNDNIDQNVITEDEIQRAKDQTLLEAHLPPMGLTVVVFVCSGLLFILALRDFLTTGKNLGGTWDDMYLEFTKSKQWYDASKGWRSTQGGFTAVMPLTTDANNMGGFFIRKLCGAAGVTVHLQKLIPMLVPMDGSQWAMGHYRPLLWTGVAANCFLAAFYSTYFGDLQAAGVTELPMALLSILGIETLAIIFYLITSSATKRGPAIALPPGKTPQSCSSNIVRNTCLLITSVIGILAGRELFFPGCIIDLIPRDDVYLEWTNAFFHSPPEGTQEAVEQGLEAPLFIGDKFISQLMGLYILINCLYKFVSSVAVRYGSDGSGVIKSRMIWRVQAIGCMLMLIVFRFFTPAAGSASLDVRWHLMMVTYETFVYSVFAFL